MSQALSASDAASLRSRFAQQRAQGKRAREAAQALGVSEGLAIAAHALPPLADEAAPSLQATPLRPTWLELLKALKPCGPVMALTRNESTVHEKTGLYDKLGGNGPVGLALGEDIDLRLFFQHWHAGFAVTEEASLSLQFFDAQGLAIHKIYCRDASDRAAFQAVMAQFADPGQVPTFAPSAPAGKAHAPTHADADIDADALLQGWATLKDTHDFFDLLKTHQVERQQSFRLAEGRFTHRLGAMALRTLLHTAAADGAPIMVFVGNQGCIQIHTGPVVRIDEREIRGAQWLNILDPGFNLHLREDAIGQVWLVKKPTSDGTLTSIEAFDQDGELMAMFFGARKPGQPERAD